MQSKATTADAYFDALPDDRKAAMNTLRKITKENLPEGFEEDSIDAEEIMTEILGYKVLGS